MYTAVRWRRPVRGPPPARDERHQLVVPLPPTNLPGVTSDQRSQIIGHQGGAWVWQHFGPSATLEMRYGMACFAVGLVL